MEERKSFMGRILAYYGRRAGQSAGEFSAEIRALTDDDKRWFVAEFNKMGLPTDLPAGLS